MTKLERAGFLNAHKSPNPIVSAIRANLVKGNRLTAEQQLYLVKNPDSRKQLLRWDLDISETIEALGDVILERMPWDVSVNIPFTGMKDTDAVKEIVAWIRRFIDRNPAFNDGAVHGHAYLAVRMLADIPDHLLKQNVRKLGTALWKCRGSGLMAGYWHVEDYPRRTLYHRPATYDL